MYKVTIQVDAVDLDPNVVERDCQINSRVQLLPAESFSCSFQDTATVLLVSGSIAGLALCSLALALGRHQIASFVDRPAINANSEAWERGAWFHNGSPSPFVFNF